MGESRRFYLMVLVSLGLNLFLLPVIAGSWFWSSRAERLSLEELHPAEVKTVTLHAPKPPPPPKLKKQAVRPVPAVSRHQPSAAKPKTKPVQTAPRPHVMAMEGSGTSGTSAPSVIQGTGQAGTPVLPGAPPLPAQPQGETRSAIALSSPVPQIPESLRTQVLKTYVRVRFDIAADGTAQVTLLTSSGSAELDQLTLQSLRQWRWKPALRDGVPIPSTQRLRVEFEVE